MESSTHRIARFARLDAGPRYKRMRSFQIVVGIIAAESEK